MANASKKTNIESQKGFKIFAGTGRFAVKFRWLILIFWIVATVVAVQKLPSLSSVIDSNNSNFLPASSPTEKSLNLAKVFGETTNSNPIPVVITSSSGSMLTTADQQAIGQLRLKLKQVPKVQQVQDAGTSADGKAEELVVKAHGGSFDPTSLVANLRSAIKGANLPSDLKAHLAGEIATDIDNSKQTGSTNTQLELGSALFIILLLLLIFRAPLAPFITLIPPLLVATLSGPLIAEVAHHGLKVSPFVELLLTVLVLGAGTDYGLFLIFRVREEMQAGLDQREAIVKALSRVGESITFSAATVIAALLSLLLASFELYSDLGGPLAIGIALMLLAGLTLLPALLAIFGRAVFWPSKRYRQPGKYGLWGRLSSQVVRHPLPLLAVGLVVFGALVVAVPGYKAGGFGGNTTAPAGSDSAAGNAALAKHFPSSSANPTSILFVLPKSAWEDPQQLVPLQSKLSSSSEFTGVSGPLNPNGLKLGPTQIMQLHNALGGSVPSNNIMLPVYVGKIPTEEALQIYQVLKNYISSDGRTVQFAVGLKAGDPSSTSAMNATPQIRNTINSIAKSVGAKNSAVLGQASALYDINSISNHDLVHVVPVAIIVIGILLGILIRSLVAPLYLVASVALSYLAALGMSVLIFLDIGHESGLTFILPFLMFLFLLALGEDYNILVMTRIREEAHDLPLKEAVSKSLVTTGTTVTSAGLVLAGTFAVLAVVGGSGSSQVRDIGAGLAIGILMDTFIVRTLLVPSIVVLLGRWNWWPSKHGSWAGKED